MKKIIISMLILIVFCSSACQIEQQLVSYEEMPIAVIESGETITLEPTSTNIVIISTPTITHIATIVVTPIAEITQSPKPLITQKATAEPTTKPTENPTRKFTPQLIATAEIVISTAEALETPKPTPAPTPEKTSEPTVIPTKTPEPIAGANYMEEITPASSSYINNVMAAINTKRKENGADNAILDNSFSNDCKAHATDMAKSGNCYHSNNPGGCEGVSRNYMIISANSLGSAMVVHVSQLASSEITKIGIEVIYYGDYVFVCIRGK